MSTEELIQLSLDKKPTEFYEMFSEMLDERVGQALQERRIQIAESLYGDEIEEESELDEDLDLEDLDISLEELVDELDEEDLDEAE